MRGTLTPRRLCPKSSNHANVFSRSPGRLLATSRSEPEERGAGTERRSPERKCGRGEEEESSRNEEEGHSEGVELGRKEREEEGGSVTWGDKMDLGKLEEGKEKERGGGERGEVGSGRPDPLPSVTLPPGGTTLRSPPPLPSQSPLPPLSSSRASRLPPP
eukprot:2608760-Rhodomonas_salina.2